MAVIQDLPPELLYRILELLDYWGREFLRQPIYHQTSLVAQSWRHPSQALMIADTSCCFVEELEEKLEHHLDGLAEPAVVKKLETDSVAQLELVLNRTRGLRVLRVNPVGPEGQLFPAPSVGRALLAGVLKLNLDAELEGPLCVTPPPSLALTHLLIDHMYYTDTDFTSDPPVEQLSRLATNLIALRLKDPAPDDDIELELIPSLKELAPELRKLVVEQRIGPKTLPATYGITLAEFVPLCTNLVFLKLSFRTEQQVASILASLRCTLLAFEVVDIQWNLKSGVEALVKALDFPALRRLRILRHHFDEALYPTEEDQVHRCVKVLGAACKARGIKFRDYRRFFEDIAYDSSA